MDTYNLLLFRQFQFGAFDEFEKGSSQSNSDESESSLDRFTTVTCDFAQLYVQIKLKLYTVIRYTSTMKQKEQNFCNSPYDNSISLIIIKHP